jgi:three-Cys-motif partner protein
MPSVGPDHFKQYTPQNRVKHAILTAYFQAYLRALNRVADAFHYVDAFAGPGTYAGSETGSPLAAVALLANQSKPASASFVESDRKIAESLRAALAESPEVSNLFDTPLVENEEFSNCSDRIFSRPIYSKHGRVATFAFVDPCGVVGLRMQDLAKILKLPFGECLVFWNYDGLNRWLGGVGAGTHERKKLDDFFGDDATASRALNFRESSRGEPKEQFLRNLYIQAVREHAGAEFCLPFRFQSPEGERTSHYLIHLSRHHLAFKIMKEVMHRVASPNTDAGVFEFVPPSELGNQTSVFSPNIDGARAEIMKELKNGDRAVSLFADEWVRRPHDFLIAEDYKMILLEMEAEGAIEVIDEKTRLPKPADKRTRAGKVTLGDTKTIAGGYLWSPKRKANNHRNAFYESMREVAPGDIIFTFRDTRIAALGIARSYCYESPEADGVRHSRQLLGGDRLEDRRELSRAGQPHPPQEPHRRAARPAAGEVLTAARQRRRAA